MTKAQGIALAALCRASRRDVARTVAPQRLALAIYGDEGKTSFVVRTMTSLVDQGLARQEGDDYAPTIPGLVRYARDRQARA